MMLLAPAIGGSSATVGLYLSWSYDTPVGGTIVLVATATFLIAWLLAPRHGLLIKRWRRPSQQEPADVPQPPPLPDLAHPQDTSPAVR